MRDNQYLYILRNCFKQVENQVYIYDLEQKIAYGVKSFENNKPSGFRFNYSAVIDGFRIFLFGGLNNNLKLLNTLQEFDISTYTWKS